MLTALGSDFLTIIYYSIQFFRSKIDLWRYSETVNQRTGRTIGVRHANIPQHPSLGFLMRGDRGFDLRAVN